MKPGIFRVVYADPPWRFGNVKTGGSHQSGAAQKYATLSTADIAAVPVRKVAEKDSVCYLWVPVAMIDDGLTVLAAWGYKYKTMLVWEKTGRLGMGYWFRNHVEVLLFGVRGKVKAFRSSQPNVIVHPVLKHSEKPPIFREVAASGARQWRDARKVELFARGGEVEGWRFTGLESDGLDVTDADWAKRLLASMG